MKDEGRAGMFTGLRANEAWCTIPIFHPTGNGYCW